VCASWRWRPDQHSPSRGDRHADLDEDTNVGRSNAPIDPNEVARAGVPLGRVGRAQDIANGVLFLAPDASNYMTGAELMIDRGMTAAQDLAGADAGLLPPHARVRVYKNISIGNYTTSLAGSAGASNRPLPGHGEASLFP
jgi:hypothetical protein